MKSVAGVHGYLMGQYPMTLFFKKKRGTRALEESVPNKPNSLISMGLFGL